jgi:hypothetical protein
MQESYTSLYLEEKRARAHVTPQTLNTRARPHTPPVEDVTFAPRKTHKATKN